MTAMPRQAGAAPHVQVAWHAIDWQQTHQNVRRLQARIVKATQEGRWGKVKALQRLLTHSFSGKALAVKRVTENQGKRTPGVDQVTWETPEAKTTAIQTNGASCLGSSLALRKGKPSSRMWVAQNTS